MSLHRERSRPPAVVDVQLDDDGSRPTVVVCGEVDLSNVDVFSTALDTAITQSGGRAIELDFRETAFMSSAGVTALLAAHMRLGQLPEAIVLRDPSPQVRRVLDLAGVTKLFTLHPATPDQGPSPPLLRE